MLFANLIVDALAAFGLMTCIFGGGIVALAATFAKSDAGKALLGGLKKPTDTPAKDTPTETPS